VAYVHYAVKLTLNYTFYENSTIMVAKKCIHFIATAFYMPEVTQT